MSASSEGTGREDLRWPPPVRRVLETALYVDDLSRARRFYEEILGLDVMTGGDRLVALDAGEGSVLLLFLRGASLEGGQDDPGHIPGHDGSGPVHLALAVDADNLDAWRSHLAAAGVAVVGERTWPRGGVSLYFRDPDEHLLELATPGIWPVY